MLRAIHKNKSSVYTILCITFLVMQSCTSLDSFSVPKIVCNDPNLQPNLSVSELKAKALNVAYLMTDDNIVEAYVVSDDGGGNFYKSISLTSKDGSYGFSMLVNRENIHTFFETGRQVFIKTNGLSLTKKNDEVVLGILSSNEVDMIPNELVDTFLYRACQVVPEEDLVQPTKLSSLSNAYLNRLVEIDSVQFSALSSGLTYYDPNRNAGFGTNHEIEDEYGKRLIVRVSSFANFAKDTVPAGIAKIRGVLQKYGGKFQLIIRDKKDVQVYAKPALWGFSKTPISGTMRTIRHIRDSFLKGKTTITSPSYIEGLVTLSPNDADNTGSVFRVYMQDTSAGIAIYTSAMSRLKEGYKIRINLQNAQLKVAAKGLLQVESIYPSTHIQLLATDQALPTPKDVSLKQVLAGEYESELVAIQNVQFTQAPSLLSGSTYITDGDSKVLVYTSSYASFANSVTPSGNGTFVGIVSKFGNPQLLIRNTIFFSSFKKVLIRPSQTPILRTVKYVRDLAKGLPATDSKQIAEDILIKAWTISKRQSLHIMPTNAYLQDTQAGIFIKFTEAHRLDVGDEATIRLKGATLSKEQGQITLSNLSLSNIMEVKNSGDPNPKLIKLSDISNRQYQSMLVAIADVQFFADGTYVQSEKDTFWNIGTCDEQVPLVVKKESTFGNRQINQNKGKLIAIIGGFKSSAHLLIRDEADIQFSDIRSTCTKQQLMITELADPLNISNAPGTKFIELYNSGTTPVATTGWKLKHYATPTSTKFTTINIKDTTIAPQAFFIIANAPSYNTYSVNGNADQVHSGINFTGDEVVELWNGSDELIDVFGLKNPVPALPVFTDGYVRRKSSITTPNPIFTINEWEIISGGKNFPADYTPNVR